MTAATGRFGKLKVGPTPTAVGELRNWRFGAQGSEIDSSIMGTGNARSDVGPISNTGGADVYWDPADAGQLLIVVGQEVDIELYPDNDTTGKTLYSGTVRISGFNFSATVAGMVEGQITWGGDGVLTPSTVP